MEGRKLPVWKNHLPFHALPETIRENIFLQRRVVFDFLAHIQDF